MQSNLAIATLTFWLTSCASQGQTSASVSTLQSNVSVDMTVQPSDLIAVYSALEPVSALEFRRVAGPARSEDWNVPPEFLLRHNAEDGTDRLFRLDGAPFGRVSVSMPARYRVLPKEYAPFSPFSDGGLLLHTGRLQVCEETCPEDDSTWSQRMSLSGWQGAHVIEGGSVHANGTAQWIDTRNGKNIYVGSATPIETDEVVGVVDPALPDLIKSSLDDLLPLLIKSYAEKFGHLDAKPELFVSMEPPPDLPPGSVRKSAQGGTLPGQIFMHLSGNFWLFPTEEWSAEDRRFIPVFFAHEVAHLYQRLEDLDIDLNEAWIHEGGADALALAMLHELDVLSLQDIDAEVEARLQSCASGLETLSMLEFSDLERFDLHYACGMAVQLAAMAEGADLFDIWRDYQRSIRLGSPYGSASFEKTMTNNGAQKAADLAKQMRFQAARPSMQDLLQATAGWRTK